MTGLTPRGEEATTALPLEVWERVIGQLVQVTDLRVARNVCRSWRWIVDSKVARGDIKTDIFVRCPYSSLETCFIVKNHARGLIMPQESPFCERVCGSNESVLAGLK